MVGFIHRERSGGFRGSTHTEDEGISLGGLLIASVYMKQLPYRGMMHVEGPVHDL